MTRRQQGLHITIGEASGQRSRGCAGKVGYPSRVIAQSVADSLVRKGRAKDPETIGVYECRECVCEETKRPAWHIGHRKG